MNYELRIGWRESNASKSFRSLGTGYRVKPGMTASLVDGQWYMKKINRPLKPFAIDLLLLSIDNHQRVMSMYFKINMLQNEKNEKQ